jgi:hypothetical protein
MTMTMMRRAAWLLAWAVLLVPQEAGAQARGGAPALAGGDTVTVDPITCWWRTTTPSVHVGEQFQVVLTCSVVDAETVTVLPDQSGLEPSVIQFPPFEVLGGLHNADLEANGQRFFQYQYTLRLISESEFDADVPLPNISITYRVRSMTGGEAVDSREHEYDLPPMHVHVQSLVPHDANNIRDSIHETFADVEALSFRADALVVTGGVCFALAAAFVLLGGVRLARGVRPRAKAADRLLADQRVLAGVAGELAEIRRARDQGGWTDELAGRALAALRIAAGYVLDRRASQQRAEPGAPAREGAISVAAGRLGGRTIDVSGSATAETLAQALRAHAGAGVKAGRLPLVESLQHAFAAFNAARYGRGGELDTDKLDEALNAGDEAVAALRKEHTPVARAIRAITSRRQTEARS